MKNKKNHPKVESAIEKAVKELMELTPEEFDKALNETTNEYGDILLEGVFLDKLNEEEED